MRTIPLGRVSTPIECEKAIAFLAFDAASYVAGETIEVTEAKCMTRRESLAVLLSISSDAHALTVRGESWTP
jgi:hypothetical protein